MHEKLKEFIDLWEKLLTENNPNIVKKLPETPMELFGNYRRTAEKHNFVYYTYDCNGGSIVIWYDDNEKLYKIDTYTNDENLQGMSDNLGIVKARTSIEALWQVKSDIKLLEEKHREFIREFDEVEEDYA